MHLLKNIELRNDAYVDKDPSYYTSFISGPAGVGKSFIIDLLYSDTK